MDYDGFRTDLDAKQEKIVDQQGVRAPLSHCNMVDALQPGAGGASTPDVVSATAAWSGQAADPWAGGTGADPRATGASGTREFGGGTELGQLDAFGQRGKSKKGQGGKGDI